MRPLPSFEILINEQINDSLEAFARICVNGFLFDPEVNIFRSFSLPLQSDPYAVTPGASLNRGRSITQKFREFQRSMLRPFALATRAPPTLAPHSTNNRGGRNGYPYEATAVDGGFAGFDNGYLNSNFNTNGMSFANLNGQTLSPDYSQAHHRDSTLSLPFRLSISHIHSKTHRNVPYLRQSWTRIDFLAIVCFWITFGLATTGFEHGSGGLHIGVFRAISVIRIARLLSVTSGTTVSYLFVAGSGVSH